ncbi:MAG: thiamine phosphate synthase [Proteobacteria bacterium]|nr:thiamine phosphate synthase [Pseudomonadota bacterium]MDA1356546.1 thiamine phosphate synthase [Pseudomonadota bacterium]
MKLTELAKRLNSENAAGCGLPPLLLITDAQRLPDPAGAAERLPRGSAVLLRDYDLVAREALARQLAEVARRRGLKLLIAGDAVLAMRVGAAGIHLPEARAGEARRWRHRRHWLITVAAHSRQALHQAAMCGADAALLSPVFATASHPEERPLGLEGFNLLAARSRLPVYALGGINPNNAARLLNGRAAGIAAIAAFAD